MRSDAPGTMAPMVEFIAHPRHWEDWGELLYAVRTGKTSAEKLRGMPFLSEYAKLLSRAGFRQTRIVPTAGPMSIVEAVPA